ncbi:MAG: cytidine deaminase [Acidobacteria bacterium]|nr:cytidine deaminase [Acidobacteriota bacterium]MBI3657297.1 cytidine deaminase [Acidobacteriota bacterium]
MEQALKARLHAYAPFSQFKVGAALQAEDGTIYTGCNVENSTYGLTVCAERVAIFKAISEGARRFTALAVVADTRRLTPPCGACRQLIWEFCGNIPVTLTNLKGKTRSYRMKALLPEPFSVKFLEEK